MPPSRHSAKSGRCRRLSCRAGRVVPKAAKIGQLSKEKRMKPLRGSAQTPSRSAHAAVRRDPKTSLRWNGKPHRQACRSNPSVSPVAPREVRTRPHWPGKQLRKPHGRLPCSLSANRVDRKARRIRQLWNARLAKQRLPAP